MGCISRFVVIGAIAMQLAASVLGLLVLGSAGVLGEAAIMSADDVIVLLVLMALNLLATIVLGVKVWAASRSRKQMREELARYRVGTPPTQ